MKEFDKTLTKTTKTIAAVAIAAFGTIGVVSGSALAADTHYTNSLQLGTANPGGGYYTMGSEFANIFAKRISMPGLNVSAIETGGSVDNLAKMSRNEIQLGLAQASTAKLIFGGEGKYKDMDMSNVGLIGCLEPYALHVFTLSQTGIESIDDLKNKRVAIGAPGSANQLASGQLMDAYGFGEKDYKAFPEASDNARQKLRDGNLDAIIDVQPVPFPGLQELESAKGGVRLLSIDPAHMKILLKNSSFSPFTIAAGSYDFDPNPVETVSDWSCMFASKTQVSPELGYELTKTIYEHADDLTMPSKKAINAQSALPEGMNISLHSGATKYYKEKNILK